MSLLRRVAVRRDFVWLKRLVAHGVVRPLRQLAARSGHAGLGIDHDPLRADKVILHRRGQTERDAGRIAAGIPEYGFPLDLVAVQLRERVDGLLMQLVVGVVEPVPRFIIRLFLQAEIRAEVDEFNLLFMALGGKFLRQTVLHACEHDIAARDDLFRGDELHIAAVRKGRIDVAELFAREADRADGRKLRLRMPQNNAHEFDSRVARRADDTDFNHGCVPPPEIQ